MNKHLKKIIDEYLNYELKFKDELLRCTRYLLVENCANWYYYNKYIICDTDYSRYKRRDELRYKYKLKRYDDTDWRIIFQSISI